MEFVCAVRFTRRVMPKSVYYYFFFFVVVCFVCLLLERLHSLRGVRRDIVSYGGSNEQIFASILC